MTIREAKRKIFARLCQELQEPGSDGWMPPENFHSMTGVPENVYQKALAELRDCIEVSHSTREIRLDANSRSAFKQGRNPFWSISANIPVGGHCSPSGLNCATPKTV